MSHFSRLTKFTLALAAAAALSSCAASAPMKPDAPQIAEKQAQEAIAGRTAQSRPPSERPLKEFSPASEDISPLRTKKITISARNSPLRDVIYTVAEAASLNVIMEKGVDPDTPVTISLKNMSAKDVLDTVLSSVDYFYSVEGNILAVKLMDTRIFEFGQPSVIQEYSVEVGGDMLGGVKTGSSGVSGSIVQKVQSDKDSFKFWDSMEKSIATMLGTGQASTQGPGPSFSVNRMTGTIVVTAPKGDLERVERYISAVRKILKRQVLVEARIVEVQLSDSLKYGIDWSFLGGDWDGVGTVGFGTTGFRNTLTNLPKFNFALTGGDFTALLQALQQQGNVNVLSNPRVNIMNGQTAYLSVGRKTDYISKVETTSTGSTTAVPTITFTVETTSVLSGIVFGIVPFINDREDGEISMTISPIISDLVRLDSKSVGTSDGNSVEISLPVIDLRELSTTVQVRDGQMVIIGGLIQNKESLRDNSVPFLSGIPLLGPLFTNRDKVNEKTELIIILKPMVAPEA